MIYSIVHEDFTVQIQCCVHPFLMVTWGNEADPNFTRHECTCIHLPQKAHVHVHVCTVYLRVHMLSLGSSQGVCHNQASAEGDPWNQGGHYCPR